jgi:hypothetical protein
MQSLRGFGDCLKAGVKLPWGQLAKQGIDATKATAELGKTWQDAAPKLAQLNNLDQFFKAFDSPVAKLAVSSLPFASVGIELLRSSSKGNYRQGV